MQTRFMLGVVWGAILLSSLCVPATHAGWPSAGQLGEARALAEKLAEQAVKLQTEITKKWPANQEFINRAAAFANRCQHLIAIMSEAIRKGEHGRHTQSAYGSVRKTWSELNALPAASGIADWKERHKINQMLDQLAAYYQ